MAHPAQVRRLGRFFLQPPCQKDWRGFEGCTKSTREKIASLTLLRMRELVAMTQGRGTAEESENPLPAVATPYLIQVLFNKYPPGDVPIRTMRELRTVAAVIDYVVNNDPLRALDVLVQRFKALELSHEQQSWAQASQLELILSDQTSAVFCQEVKAAQAEEVELATRSRSPALLTCREPQEPRTSTDPSVINRRASRLNQWDLLSAVHPLQAHLELLLPANCCVSNT